MSFMAKATFLVIAGTGACLCVWGALGAPPATTVAGGLALTVGLAGLVLQLVRRRRVGQQTSSLRTQIEAVVRAPQAPADMESLTREMLVQGRYALMLRPQIALNLPSNQHCRAWEAFEKEMAIIPAGEIAVGMVGDEEDEDEIQALAHALGDTIIQADEYAVDRHAVMNAQFRAFVQSGGYQQPAIWDQQILPALKDFVDQSGSPGPRYWKNGTYPAGEGSLPVVGINWFEATAYARWVGKRLPSDAEWEKAGSAPVQVSDEARMQRRYPWGNSMDRTRCNVWGSGPGKPLPVDAHPEGSGGQGIRQLIGNVWEWTDDDFGVLGSFGYGLTLPHPMKSVRGGAFDTYFENQATCQFSSGESPLARKHNVGFRCALSTCDIEPPAHATTQAKLSQEVAEELLETASV